MFDFLKKTNKDKPKVPPILFVSPDAYVFIAAVESGLLPEIKMGMEIGYDGRLFYAFLEELKKYVVLKLKPELDDRDGLKVKAFEPQLKGKM